MSLTTLNRLFCWLDDNNALLGDTQKALRLLNSSCCMAVFRILDKNDKITCNEVLSLGRDDSLEETTVYRCLKELEELNFVCAQTKKIRFEIRTPNMKQQYVYKETGEQVFSLNRGALSKFIDLVNRSNIAPKQAGGQNFKVEYGSPLNNSTYVLDYSLLKDIYSKTNCLISKRKRGFLRQLLTANEPLADTQFKSEEDHQSTILRNLKQLEKCDLTARERNKNFVDNSLEIDTIVAIITFLQSISYLNSKRRTNPRRPYVSKVISGISFKLRD